MASFPNIPRILLFHVLILILSPPFLDQGHKLAAADYALITAECNNSKTPRTCMKCVTSDPGAEEADRIGIATIVVNCISSQAVTLAKKMNRLASGEKDLVVRIIFTKCSYGYVNAINLDSSAKQALNDHNYGKAAESVVQVQESNFACQSDLHYHPGKVPIGVTYNMSVYGELSEAASVIIKRL